MYYGGDRDILTLSKVHNKANILSLGGRFLSTEESLEAITLWLETDFENEERHQRRIDKISTYEKERN